MKTPSDRARDRAFWVGTICVLAGSAWIHPGLMFVVFGAGILWAFNDDSPGTPTKEERC